MASTVNHDFSCPRCGVGRCQPKTTTFVETFAGQILCVPNILAYICDVCHFAEFEQSAIESLWDEVEIDGYSDDMSSLVKQKRSSSFGE